MNQLGIRFQKALKNIVKPEIIPTDYWRGIVWVAQDMRRAVLEANKKRLDLLDNKHVTLLFSRPHGRFELAFSLACDLLGARKTLYHDPNFENQTNPSDSARALSVLTDMFILHGLHHSILAKLIGGATVPVYSASSDTHCLQKGLSDMMTFYERFKRLKGLTVAWIGPPNPIFNSYLVFCSQFGMSLRYTLICYHGAGRMSPVHAPPTHRPDIQRKDFSMEEFKTAEETIVGANIVATSMHPDENNKITTEVLKKADPDYVFVHTLPRGTKEVAEEVVDQKNDMTWKATENYLYVAMAVIVTSLLDYTPKLSRPTDM